MRNLMRVSALAVCLGLLAGCSSIVGTWRTVKVEPAEYRDYFAFSSVTFGEDGRYTATAKYEGQVETSTGEYKWDGSTLTVMPDRAETRKYPGELETPERLVLRHNHEGTTMTGVMEKQASMETEY